MERDETPEPLVGGNSTPEVVRVGTTVRRTAGSRSAFVAELLNHLRDIGFAGSPAYLGTDDGGYDIFEFLDGDITTEPSERAPAAFATGGRMLRALHDATSGQPLAEGDECIMHGDPGLFNTVFRDGLPVAFIDWDSSRPGTRLGDLAYMGWTWCVHEDWDAAPENEAQQLREMRDGYGMFGADELVDAIIERQHGVELYGECCLAEMGHLAEWYDQQRAAIDWARTGREHLERHRETFLVALRKSVAA